MDDMHSEMFKGFGGGMMMRDPFKDDPFFNGGDDIFGNANKMMAQMQQEMRRGMSDMPKIGQG